MIIKAIGGFRKVSGFVCVPRNNSTGHDWDACLAGQVNGLCHFFAITCDRGSAPLEKISTTAGETFKIFGDSGFALMEPTVEKIENSAQRNIASSPVISAKRAKSWWTSRESKRPNSVV